jgi:glucose-1-phosphate adenylyltransferase
LGRPDISKGEDVYIERAIIDKNARFGNGVVIHSHEGKADRETDFYAIRNGIVIIPKNTTIPEETTI